MKDLNRIDSEISRKNYENELVLCQKAGGDIERYRRLSFDVLQLEQIRIGLEKGLDVEKYLDPDMNWIQMETIREAMENGVDLEKLKDEGYSLLQCQEIILGMKEKLDVSLYKDVHFLPAQMKEIRKGLERKLDVTRYNSLDYDWVQMREIRRGLEEKVDVSKFADKKYPYSIMRAIRKGLEDKIDLVPYADKGYSGKALLEVAKGKSLGHDLSEYLEKGYNGGQLHQMNVAFELGVNLAPFLYREFHGAQLEQIIKGLVSGVEVTKYARRDYNWMQMRELRHGLENHLDISAYFNPDFTPRQMQEIQKGLIAGIDVSLYAKIYYEPEQMKEMRQQILEKGAVMTDEFQRLLRETALELPEEEEQQEEQVSDDFLLDSCVSVAEDQMSVTVDFSPVKDTLKETLERFTVPDMMRILKHHDIRQGVNRKVIHNMLANHVFDKPVVVAEGKQAVNGEDGHYDYYFQKEVHSKPKVREDGSVDYKNMQLFESVEKNKLIAEYRPASQGFFGFDVKGNLINPVRGNDQPPLHGTGFIVSEDKKKYYAMRDGIIELDESSHELNIKNLYVVNGDVDNSTGNINFNGDLNIMGNVTAGFSVTATGSVAIDGGCEGCKIYAGKDIIIRKGCQGQGTAEICASGSVVGRFFESAKIAAGENVEASYLLSCDIRAGGKLEVAGKKGVILGGYTQAKLGIECFALGNVAEIKTVVEVGIDREDLQRYQELVKQIEKVETELAVCERSLNKFMALPERDEKTTSVCERLTKAIYTQKNKRKELKAEREKMMHYMTKQREAKIVVREMVYPGTYVYMNSDLMKITECYRNVTFVKKDNTIEHVSR